MNIVYLHSHDTGRMIEPYGYAVRSPNLSKFAASAAVFRQAFTVNPTCSPSRGALLTGQYAHHCGILGLTHRGFQLSDYSRHLASLLKRAGYATALSGIQHETRDPAVVSTYYDETLTAGQTVGNDRDLATAEAAAAFIGRSHDQPFFLSVGFFATHRNFPHSTDNGSRLRPFPGLPDLPAVRQDMADYQASLDILDASMGRVFQALQETGRDQDTIVICTTDHGPAFPGMKCTMRDDGLGVMLMLRIPGEPGAGHVIDAMVTHLDVIPTLQELLGLVPTHSLDGKSLLPLIRGQQKILHEAVFAETNFHSAYEPQRAIRTDQWKYIRRFISGPPRLPNMDDGLTKQVLYEGGRFEGPVEEEFLFDLIGDPGETRNLIATSRFEPILQELRDRLLEWQQTTADPILNGPLVAPAQARVTGPENYSPTGGFPPGITKRPT